MIMVMGERKIKSLQQAKEELEDTFNHIMDSDEKGIFIIKAPTGIGKTELYINACKDRNLTIAVPTHKLKDEVSERLIEKSVQHYVIPELPELSRDDKIKIERLYNTGSYKAANIYLKNLARDNEGIKEYLRKLKKSQDIKNQTIITTSEIIIP